LPKGRCEKINLVLLHVIPAAHKVRGELQPESSVFMALQTDWTPVFTGVTTKIQFLHSFRGIKEDFMMILSISFAFAIRFFKRVN